MTPATPRIKRQARRLFDLARVDGRVDDARLRLVLAELVARQPRGCAALLKNLLRRTIIETHLHSAQVEAAIPLSPVCREAFSKSLTGRFGAGLDIRFLGNPALLGGARIRVGDTLIDGSILGRLEELRRELKTLAPRNEDL